MPDSQTDPPTRTFGHRKLVSRVCVVAHKPHVRTFLRDAIEEIGLLTSECAEPEALAVVLDADRPDLVVIGVTNDGFAVDLAFDQLAQSLFGGPVLLIGHADLPSLSAALTRGKDLGLAMLPVLTTPYRHRDLRERLSAVLSIEPPDPPPVDVAGALHSGWFELWYQPKVEMRSLELCGAEALIRLRHPTWGVVPPAYFIPDDGDPHFRALSEFVIEQAIADWHYFVDSYKPVELAINLPLAYLKDPASLGELARRLPRHPAFRGLIVEINGTEVVRELDATMAIARQARFHNIGISIDDLGAEWPQFLAIDEFPFVEIKVDRKFVSDCAEDKLKQLVCRRIVELAEGYGVRTVAEGVETRAEFLAVREIGFHMVQGFLVAKPMGVKKFARTALRGPIVLGQ
jgi:EAL domain-containing protein (putative c-di-GMP-specific phosphodiesterase class I)/CheY-like chemotaxis protein